MKTAPPKQGAGNAPPRSGTPGAPAAASSGAARAHGRDRVLRPLGEHPAWDPEGAAAPAAPTAGPALDLPALVSALVAGSAANPKGALAALEPLCAALRRPGYELAEAACERGAVEASLALLGEARCTGEAGVGVARGATEALWLLCDDHSSCQRLIRAQGHELLFGLLRDLAPQDAALATGAFRLLTSTLYGEARASGVWRTLDAGFLTASLEWALRADAEGAADGRALGFVCDVVALWALRVGTSCPRAALPLLRVVPALLARMAAARDDAYLQRHGCRLLWALASTCRDWPEGARRPALAALTELAVPLQLCMDPEVRAYGGMAARAVAALGCGGGLSSMD